MKPNSRVIIVTDSHNVVSSKDEVDRYLKKMEESGDGLTEITDSIIIEEKNMKNIDILPIDLKKKISSSEVIINISIQITK